MIQLSSLNPIRLMGQNDFMTQYNCYCQKWQDGDVINAQFLSDESFTVSLIDHSLGFIVLDIPITLQPTNLVDVDFSVYEISLPVNNIPDYGFYRFRITNSTGTTFDSYPFNYQSMFEKTLLLNYRNSENDFNMIFETGIEFFLRFEGDIINYTPKLDGDIYIDQKFDPTMIKSQSFNTFTLQAGGNKGIPVWMSDIINEAFSCDMKRVNNVDIERNEGADWEVVRVDNYSLIGMTLEVLRSGDIGNGQILKSNFVLANEVSELVTNNNNKIFINK